MKKRLALIIMLAMIMTSLPALAFADETVQTTETNTEETTEEQQVTETPKNKVVDLIYYNASGNVDMSAGWKKDAEGNKAYYSNGSAIVTKPTRIKGSKKVTKKVKYYWNKKTKKWQTKKRKHAKTKYVKKTKKVATNYLYMFGTNGKLITTKGVFPYKVNGKTYEYYGLGKGVLKTGWVSDGKHAMYFDKKTGRMAKNTKVGYLKVPANGRLGKSYALGVEKLDDTKWTLKQAFKNSSKMKYKGRGYRAKDAETYALRGFTKGYGNCYVMASTFYIQAKLLGYDARQVEGKVPARIGGLTAHSWVSIREDGKEKIYDPEFTWQTKRNGYRIHYGKKGTWRYCKYHYMN